MNYPVEHTERLIITHKSRSSIQKSAQDHMSRKKKLEGIKMLAFHSDYLSLEGLFINHSHSYTHMNAHMYTHNHLLIKSH